MIYNNRQQAGEVLADLLVEYKNKVDTLIFALPRGGIPVAFEIAKSLSLPLDVLVVRKLGVPHFPELAMGSIATGSKAIFNEALILDLGLTSQEIDVVLQREQQELRRRELLYRQNKPFPCCRNKNLIIVDDGIATGYTLRAAIMALKQAEPKQLVIAVPVGASEVCEELSHLVTKVVCPLQPNNFRSVGVWYRDFTQIADAEVLRFFQSFDHLKQ